MDSFEFVVICKPFYSVGGGLEAKRADLRIELNGSQTFLPQCPEGNNMLPTGQGPYSRGS